MGWPSIPLCVSYCALVFPEVMIVVGGQAPKAIRSVECYDFEEGRWDQIAELPSRRCRAGERPWPAPSHPGSQQPFPSWCLPHDGRGGHKALLFISANSPSSHLHCGAACFEVSSYVLVSLSQFWSLLISSKVRQTGESGVP